MLTHYFLGLVTTGLLGFDNLAAAVLLRSQPDGIFPSIRPQDGDVPSVNGYPRCSDAWFGIGQELQDWFIDDEGLCTDLAAQAVRLPFHDCFPDGGCDGSIILSDECTTRSENRQMIPICGVLYKISVEWRVGAADLINFAASVANKACPYGPYIPFYIGRKDNDTSAPKDQIPPSFSTAPDLVKAFQARNFTAYDLVAMVGSHSCGGNLSFVPFDTTPGAMDSPTYYTEVLTGEAPATMPSDKMTKMITLENDERFLYDCSQIIYKLFEDDEYDDGYYDDADGEMYSDNYRRHHRGRRSSDQVVQSSSD